MSNSSSNLLALRSAGAVSAIGNSALQTCASWLTQVRRQRKIKINGYADPFTVADCHTVTAGLSGIERLSAMLASAVAEAYDNLTSAPPLLPSKKSDKHWFKQAETSPDYVEILVLPTYLSTEECDQLSARLSEWLADYPLWCDNNRERLIVRADGTGAWTALEYAYRLLEQKPNLQHIMIAAVDSLCEPVVLQQAAKANYLLQASNGQGYVAGEAAACLHLSRVHHITEVPADGFALHRPALLHTDTRLWPSEAQTDARPLEQALTAALKLAAMEATNISHLESNMDGSDWRGLIESNALSKIIYPYAGGLPHWRPASLLGQSGAASGLLGWLLPALLHARQVDRINTVLNWTMEPSGEIAACVLERSPH